ncbi:MAG: hypothetical protein ACOH5I_10530 [Oligoflexus sp.]
MFKFYTLLSLLCFLPACASIAGNSKQSSDTVIIGASHVKKADLEQLANEPHRCHKRFKANSLLKQVHCKVMPQEVSQSR